MLITILDRQRGVRAVVEAVRFSTCTVYYVRQSSELEQGFIQTKLPIPITRDGHTLATKNTAAGV